LVAIAAAVVDGRRSPPRYSDLISASVVLSGPIEIKHRYKGTPYASVASGIERRIENVDILWADGTPRPIAALGVGDKITIWMNGYNIWQVEVGGSKVVGYEQSVEAFRKRHAAERIGFEVLVGVGCLTMLAALLL
jgi:hypothetical protein